MTTTGDKCKGRSRIARKGLKVAIFWLQVFGDLGMTKITSGLSKRSVDATGLVWMSAMSNRNFINQLTCTL